MDGSFDISKTRRVYGHLRERIGSGEVTPGTRLPSEPELAQLYSVSRVTIRRALGELEREGLISRRPGAGTFVTSRIVQRPIVADLTNAIAHFVEMGRTASVRVLTFGYVEPSVEIAQALRLEAGTKVQRSVRVRSLDGAPFSHLVSHVPADIGLTFDERELTAQSLLTLIERSGTKLDRATQTIAAIAASSEVATNLGIAEGAPVLSVTRIVYDARRRGVQHLTAVYRPDRYSFHMDLLRIDSGGDRLWSTQARTNQEAGFGISMIGD